MNLAIFFFGGEEFQVITVGKSVRRPAMLFCTFRSYPELYYYLAVCTLFPHFLAPIWQLYIFFLQLPLSFQSSSINPFSPISPLIPSAQVSLGLPRVLLILRSYLQIPKNKKPTRSHLLFYCTSCKLNMLRALLCPSSKLATMMLISTLFVSFLVCCMLEVRCG